MVDWSLGEYEVIARELEPVAIHAVDLADPQPGERLVDLATGTGNAALLAARRGAVVTGVDAAERLIAVARQRAVREGAHADFAVGDVESLPYGNGSFDVALSVFGVIFALDAEAAFDELLRVLRPGGRAVVTAWVPGHDPLSEAIGVFARAVAEVTPTDAPRPRFPWHDASAVRALADRRRATARFHDGALVVEADSPEDYLATLERHPANVASAPALRRAGVAERVRAEALAILQSGNEDTPRFRASRPYRLIELHAAPADP